MKKVLFLTACLMSTAINAKTNKFEPKWLGADNPNSKIITTTVNCKQGEAFSVTMPAQTTELTWQQLIGDVPACSEIKYEQEVPKRRHSTVTSNKQKPKQQTRTRRYSVETSTPTSSQTYQCRPLLIFDKKSVITAKLTKGDYPITFAGRYGMSPQHTAINAYITVTIT